ncbi:MAG: 50S ribosomal protein L4 [Armatimonadetes bacterium]|jgi:large subunit ribosomal protein L4|nr:50S ribosomal protein L4 [Armatimonadota bacterium]
MPTVDVKDMAGQTVGDLALRDDFFGITPNEPVMHQAVVTHLANRRQGTHDTRTRGEVAGGARKPYRQKGTGRARQGTIRAPQYRHGGVVFGPHPRDYHKVLPRKMRRLAIASAFSARVAADDVIVVDEIRVEQISTKRMAQFLGSLGVAGKVLLILGEPDVAVWKSSRNIPDLKVTVAPNVSTYDLLWAHKIVMARAAAARFPAWEGQPE